MTNPEMITIDVENEEQLLLRLCFYTLEHRDPAFIHQHVVDAFAVQNATSATKPLKPVFGLLGLYLHLEHGWTGRQVQHAHMRIAATRRPWQMPPLPADRGAIRISDVLAVPPGPGRDTMIESWCASVWQACSSAHAHIRSIARELLQVA